MKDKLLLANTEQQNQSVIMTPCLDIIDCMKSKTDNSMNTSYLLTGKVVKYNTQVHIWNQIQL